MEQGPDTHCILPLLVRTMALNTDPIGWRCISSSQTAELDSDEDFAVEWFLRWQPVLLPHRPWQYAVLTWRRLQGAPPRRVAQFILKVLQAKREQQQLPQQQGPLQPQPQAQQPQPQQPQPQQLAQPQQLQQQMWLAADRPVALEKKYKTNALEGQFQGTLPDLQPLPSTQRRVQQLLAQHTPAADMRALLLLLPCALSFAGQYAARDTRSSSPGQQGAVGLAQVYGNDSSSSSNAAAADGSAAQAAPAVPLLQHMLWLDQVDDIWGCFTFRAVISAFGCKCISTFRLCCQAALAAGSVPHLLLRQHKEFSNRAMAGGGGKVLLPLLLRYAARYSNAACLEAVFMQTQPWVRGQRLAPQHLALAAGRTDAWAPGVVRLIMQLLQPKQLKPKHMKQVYVAAAATGHLQVLALLLRHAASAAEQHLPQLLTAVAEAGNEAVAELLLGDAAAALRKLQRQQQQWGQQQVLQGPGGMQEAAQPSEQQLLQHVQQLRDAWQCLDAQQMARCILHVLPFIPQSPHMTAADHAAEAMRLRMADVLLLQLPPVEKQHELRAFLERPQHKDTRRGRAGAAAEAAFQMLTAAERPAWLLWWLQHGLKPPFYSSVQASLQTLQQSRDRALSLGTSAHARMAVRLHAGVQAQLAQLQEGAEQRAAGHGAGGAAAGAAAAAEAAARKRAAAAVTAALCVVEGRLSAACASCDAAAAEQLEQLYMLCYLLLTPPTMAPVSQARPATTVTVAPTLPVSVAGGRVVTAAHLAAGLGLPWGLLGTLLTAAEFDQLRFADRPGVAAGCTSIQQQIEGAQLSVQDPAAAQQQLVLLMPAQPSKGAACAHLTSARRLYLLQHRGAQDNVDPTYSDIIIACERLGYMSEQASSFQHGLQQLLSQQQELQGPPPLWQQALLQVVAQQAAALRNSSDPPRPGQPFQRWAGLPPPTFAQNWGLLLHGLQAGRSAQEVQDFVAARLLQPLPQGGFRPRASSVWGQEIVQAALVHNALELLPWSLEPVRRDVLWGTSPEAVSTAVAQLLDKGITPVTPVRPLRPRPQHEQRVQQELHEMQQQRWQLMGPAGSAGSSAGPMVAASGPLPGFACSAAQLALTLLQQPGAAPTLLSDWLQHGLGSDSPLPSPDLVRARAVVAAVAAADPIPAGAQQLERATVRKVVLLGDPDLWTALLLWSHRLAAPVGGVWFDGDD